MEVLYFLEKLRNPVLDAFFSVITVFGEETFLIILGVVLFWCIDKKFGYYVLSVGFVGLILNQFLKLFFRIPRPWVKDPDFTIVEAARAEATGYSFPSGHTQSSVGSFGSLARWSKNKLLRGICIALAILVPISRMYLGVHTPLDVGVSFAIALILVFGIYPIIKKSTESPKLLRVWFGVMLCLSLGLLAFVSFYNFPSNVDIDNLEHGVKNAYKFVGAISAIWISFELDRKYINFETKATLPAQVLKVFIGIIILLGIKSGLKQPLYALFGGAFIADLVRYFLIVFFICAIWPLTFKKFAKLFAKK